MPPAHTEPYVHPPSIPWMKHSNYSWLLDDSYLIAAACLFLDFIWRTFHSKYISSRRNQNPFGHFFSFHLFLLLGIGYAPSQSFLISYHCGPPDTSGVNDLFGSGAYLGWMLVAASTLVSNVRQHPGVFYPVGTAQRTLPPAQDAEDAGLNHEESSEGSRLERPKPHSPASIAIQQWIDGLGIDGSGFFLSTCGFIIYYVAKIRAGEPRGPVLEAPERFLAAASVWTTYLYLGSWAMPVDAGKGRNLVTWGLLHVACELAVACRTPSVLFYLIMAIFGLYLPMLIIHNLPPPDRLNGEAPDVHRYLPYGLAIFTNLLAAGVGDAKEHPARAVYGNLSDDEKVACGYSYHFLPPSNHKLTDWGQAVGMAIPLILFIIRLLPPLEDMVKRFLDRVWRALRARLWKGGRSGDDEEHDVLLQDLPIGHSVA